MKVAAIFLSAFVAAALGIPVTDIVHDRRDVSGFIRREAMASETIVPVRIALKQRNLDKGMSYLMAVSDPSSRQYGEHWTADQVKQMFSPAEESTASVKRWLADAGIPSNAVRAPTGSGWVDFHATVEQLEKMLKTRYSTYEDPQTGTQLVGTEEYKLPNTVAQHVDFVVPSTVMGKLPGKRSGSAPQKSHIVPFPVQPVVPSQISKTGSANCDKVITPECIKALYSIPDAPASPNPDNRLGIFESQGEMHLQSDLDQFYSNYAPNIPAGTGPKEDFIDYNGNNPDGSEAVGEAALDFQVAIPVIYPQGTELFQTNANFDGYRQLGFINQFLDAVDGSYCTYSSHGEKGDDPILDGTTPNEQCGTFKPTSVISFSYGLDEKYYTANYLERQCEEFMKLGLQGTTLVFSSGDGGVAGGHGNVCLGSDRSIFSPSAPGSCPYVTSIGSTTLPAGSNITDPEAATSRFSSGGGFSNTWAQPDYQKDAVASFFANHDPGFKSFNVVDQKIPSSGANGGIYNRGGRGFPDMAAVGDNGQIIFNGRSELIGGTSMSAPIVAAIFNRINEERLAAGKPVIGFVNPALYKNPSMFNDITLGKQGSGGGACKNKAFSAVSGWDPVTGLGTPNYPAFSKYFASL
ncbi:hypothetical protein PWT90_07165 [Aphanocladium album]|nr:hypothetical protein PWT90_07165 [Aphanocladium album]